MLRLNSTKILNVEEAYYVLIVLYFSNRLTLLKNW